MRWLHSYDFKIHDTRYKQRTHEYHERKHHLAHRGHDRTVLTPERFHRNKRHLAIHFTMLSRGGFLYGSLVASAFLASSAYADVAFSSPSAGQVISGNTISVEFEEGSSDPPLSDFTTYTLQLCAGGNTESDYVSGMLWVRNGSLTIMCGSRRHYSLSQVPAISPPQHTQRRSRTCK